MARLAESAQMAEWVAKEDDFHLDQAKRRAAIRVRENRAKPIDILSINLKWSDPDRLERIRNPDDKGQPSLGDDEDDEAGLEIDLDEPYHIFDVSPLATSSAAHPLTRLILVFESCRI